MNKNGHVIYLDADGRAACKEVESFFTKGVYIEDSFMWMMHINENEWEFSILFRNRRGLDDLLKY